MDDVFVYDFTLCFLARLLTHAKSAWGVMGADYDFSRVISQIKPLHLPKIQRDEGAGI